MNPLIPLRIPPLACVLLAVSSLLLRSAEGSPTVRLFDGKTMEGWRKPTGEWLAVKGVSLDTANPGQFTVQKGDGVLLNGESGRTVNLLSEPEHGDVEAHVEFVIPKGSNSGIYFQGRYEIQVYDSYWVAKDKYAGIECGGIYPRWTEARGEFEGHSPRVNASKPPGQWQSLDVVFRAPRFDAAGRKLRNACFVKVVFNGQVIHENVELTGPTRAAQWEDNEKALGPVMLQGDHGPVAYRNLRLKPVVQQ